MRFLADGPSIPDELLVARDEGRVIFFCGAGVSHAFAGLPGFFGLAQNIIETLGVTADDPAIRIIQEAQEIECRTRISGLISADRVFGLLERNFLRRDIEAAVAKILKPKLPTNLSAHRIMLDLARGPDGKVRLITTNFDLLFEACDSTLRCSGFPRLPDPERDEEFEGIIHLHGHGRVAWGNLTPTPSQNRT
jgi:NAD-dependent SIR2 family protein deacetylase